MVSGRQRYCSIYKFRALITSATDGAPIGEAKMKKLHVKTESGWELVFCNNDGEIITTKDRAKALPQKAIWAEYDLNHFSSKFANNEFKLD